MCNIFRTLRADEIDVRVQQVKKSKNGKVYAMLLLYKDARVDMTLLDEEFGIYGWSREHFFKDSKNYCKVSVYDKEHNVWVAKEDVGVPSNTEADKGEASDAFKRACVNLGIGRELYSAPRLIVELAEGEYYSAKEVFRMSPNVSFTVNAIEYDNTRSISALQIVDSNGRIRKQIGETHDPRYQAVKEANDARTAKEAFNVWRKYPEYQDDARFICACKEKASILIN